MTTTEIDDFLAHQRTCRVATVARTGQPHVTPLWFAWDGGAFWLYSIVDSQRWADLQRDARIAVVVDDGEDYGELRGVEIAGVAVVVGEVPRCNTPNDELAEPERIFSEKYFAGEPFTSDGRHAWLRIATTDLRSWDFRKIAAARR